MINNMELKKKAAIAIKKNYCKCIFVPVLFILCLWLNNLFVNPIDQYSMFGKVSVSAANIFAWFGVQVFLINLCLLVLFIFISAIPEVAVSCRMFFQKVTTHKL